MWKVESWEKSDCKRKKSSSILHFSNQNLTPTHFRNDIICSWDILWWIEWQTFLEGDKMYFIRFEHVLPHFSFLHILHFEENVQIFFGYFLSISRKIYMTFNNSVRLPKKKLKRRVTSFRRIFLDFFYLIHDKLLIPLECYSSSARNSTSENTISFEARKRERQTAKMWHTKHNVENILNFSFPL